MSWWQKQCVARGAGLNHAHWEGCDGVSPHQSPDRVPRVHPFNMCCHCEQIVVSFWTTQCPVRDEGGTHFHSRACLEHEPGQCCACGAINVDEREKLERDQALREAGLPPEAQELPLIDVNQRMRSLGLMGPDEEDRDDVNLREAKMADPEKPDYSQNGMGYPWGRGRSWRGDGGLSPRDKVRLGEIIFRENKQGYR